MSISIENWTSSHYFADPLRVFISLGASPVAHSSQNPEIEYNVTVTDLDFIEQHQETYKTIEEAISVINTKYGHWKLVDANIKTAGDGCSSCAAH